MLNGREPQILDASALRDFVEAVGADDARIAVGIFLEEARGRVDAVAKAVCARDLARAAKEAHSLVGAAATFALPRLEAAARAVQEAARTGNDATAAASALSAIAKEGLEALAAAPLKDSTS